MVSGLLSGLGGDPSRRVVVIAFSNSRAASYPALQKLSRSKLHHLLTQAELRPQNTLLCEK